ncbi:hypothetical protein FS837_000592 [Tulasnella sp. UAMH 9824]|nr:hypothetical protein FS837_000592 [Tulasnella sp. UAMH 9824]
MLHKLPTEIWYKIIKILRDDGDDDWQDLSRGSQHQRRSTLLPLLLTSRYFSSIAEPLLYEHAVLYVHKEGSRSGTVVDALQAREGRKELVKTVVATRRSRPRKEEDTEMRKEESVLVKTALMFLSGLQGLRLFRTLMSDEVYQWILTQPTLRTLILQRCDFTRKGDHEVDLARSRITRLTLLQSSPVLKFPFGEVSKLFALRRLQDLTVTAPFFNHIATLLGPPPSPASPDPNSALPCLPTVPGPPPVLPNLRRLSIQLPPVGPSARDQTVSAVPLYLFLLHSPNVTHLLLQAGVEVDPLEISTPRLEHLKVLQASTEVADTLRTEAEGLETLTMNGMLELTMVAGLGEMIRHLSLDIGTDVVSALALAFPKLLSLVLRLRPENSKTDLNGLPHAVSVLIWVYNRAPQDLANLANLGRLSFQLNTELERHRPGTAIVYKNTEKRERKALASLQQTLPSLREVRLPSDRIWKLFNLDEGWEVVYRPPSL